MVNSTLPAAQEKLLELEEVEASYGRFQVLHGVTLTVNHGEIAALIGLNGAGKSTVLKAVAGFIKPSSGSIRLKGLHIGGRRPHQVLRLGCSYVAQGQDLFPKMSVRENVEMGGYLIVDRAVRRARLEESLDLFPVLREKAHVRAEGLSGGERQQLKLARALMTRPDLLLLDEPSAGLSPKLTHDLFDHLARMLEDTGIGALIVEQNLRKAFDVADTVHVLDLGRVSLSGSPRELGGVDSVLRFYLGTPEAGNGFAASTGVRFQGGESR